MEIVIAQLLELTLVYQEIAGLNLSKGILFFVLPTKLTLNSYGFRASNHNGEQLSKNNQWISCLLNKAYIGKV